ncbi:MAG: hypothetical protein HYV77_01120 [Candidatus Wildermuthbacteria bacterium]|nr:hypothetical protein [Candidatus Wildermuthbacteria bacterium]
MANKQKILDITHRDLTKAKPAYGIAQNKGTARGNRAFVSASQEKKPPHFSAIKLFGILVLCSLAGVFAIQFFFSRAYAVVWPKSRELAFQETAEIRVGENNTQLQNKVIGGQELTQEFQEEKTFSSTGRTGNAKYANGSLIVYNESTAGPQTLIATTRFISQTGKLYRSSAKVTVPAAKRQGGNTVPGQASVPIKAAEAGSEYNINDEMNFSIPGLLGTFAYTRVYAKSSQPISGGSLGEIPTVSKTDLEDAKDDLVRELTEKANESFKTLAPEGYLVLPESLGVEVLSVSSGAEEGAQAAQFSYSAKVRVRTLAFRKSDLESLIVQALRSQLGDGEDLNPSSLVFSYIPEDYNREDRIVRLGVQGKALGYKILDEAEIRSKIQGKSKEGADLALNEHPLLESAKVSFWPFWVKAIPNDQTRLMVNIELPVDVSSDF